MDRSIQPPIHTIKKLPIPKVENFTLANGTKITVLNSAVQNVIKINLIFNAGNIYANHKLVAPFCGLMLHEGTKNKNARQIAETFDYYGAYFQPTVEKDLAHTSLFVMNKHLPETLPVYSDILFNSAFPDTEFHTLKQRRQQNFRIESEKTAFLAKEKFFELLFGADHPYGQATKFEHYHELEKQQLLNFYQSQYQRGSYQIICAGNVSDHELKLIEYHFGNKKTETGLRKPKPNISEINSTAPFIIEKNNAVQSSIRMGIKTIDKNHPDYLGLKILTTILGGYFGSRLMKNIREEKGYTYGIYAMQVSMLNTGYMAIAADVQTEYTHESITEIKNEILKLKNHRINETELNLVRNYMMGELLQLFDGPFSATEAIKATLPYGLTLDYYKNMRQTILQISAKELQQLANKYFDLDKFVTVVAGKQ